METVKKQHIRALRFVSILLSLVVFAGILSSTGHVYAASNPKMTAYNQVIKKGNIVYCTGLGNNLYKVNLKTGKVYNLYTGRIAEKVADRGKSYAPFYATSSIHSMRLKGKYLYYVWPMNPSRQALYRIHTKTGKKQRLARVGKNGGSLEYVIKGKKIYVKLETSLMSEKYKYKVMKLNGKSAKKTNVKPKMKTVKSNVKGYKTRIKETSTGWPNYEVRDYLIAKNKKILLHRTIGYEPDDAFDDE